MPSDICHVVVTLLGEINAVLFSNPATGQIMVSNQLPRPSIPIDWKELQSSASLLRNRETPWLKSCLLYVRLDWKPSLLLSCAAWD